MQFEYDIAVVGAGVVGSAIARELSRFDCRVALVEASPDVGTGTSKANTAILHTGFDATPGSLESKLVTRGYELLKNYSLEVGIPFDVTGAILVAWNEEQAAQLPQIVEKANQNGVKDLRTLSKDDVYAQESQLGAGVHGGLLVPGEGLICPFTPPIAFAKEAVENGIRFVPNFAVDRVVRETEGSRLFSGSQEISARWIINASGLFSGDLDRMFGHDRFTIVPRRGELIVFDKLSRRLLRHIVLPVPTKTTKGVLVSPTIFGNIILGPTAEDLDDPNNKATSEAGLASLWKSGEAILPDLMKEEVTVSYAGLRAATEHRDYQVYLHPEERYLCVGGIRSTGLTASLAIAEYVVGMLGEHEAMPLKSEHVGVKVANIGETRSHRPFADEDLIARDGEYGRIVCFCERVSYGEIRDALRGSLPAKDLDGLRRRTRCLQGRCQGFYCLANVREMLENEIR